MHELVSVLIPAYNASRWIRDAVISALRQTWPRLEVIVVDDGSTDATLDVVRRIRSSRLCVVSQENRGASAARNAALRTAQGAYIQWLDADDLLHPQKIARQLVGSESGLTARTLLTGAWGRFFHRPRHAAFKPDALWHDLAPRDFLIAKFTQNVWMNPAVWLVSRRLTDLAGGWDPRLSSDDDGEYLCRVVSKSAGVRFVADAKSLYRMGTVGSLSWRMDRHDHDLDALALALSQSIAHLRSIADDADARAACVCLLRASTTYFCAAREHRALARLRALANELGGDLDPPAMPARYRRLERAFGTRVAVAAMNGWRDAKLQARRHVDLALSHLEPRSACGVWK